MELDTLLLADPVRRRSRFDRVKMAAGAATVGHLKDHVKFLAELKAIGPTEVWLEGVLPAKVAHFAGEPGRPTRRIWASTAPRSGRR